MAEVIEIVEIFHRSGRWGGERDSRGRVTGSTAENRGYKLIDQ